MYCGMDLLRPIPLRNTMSLVGQIIVSLNGNSFYKGLFKKQLNFLTLDSHLKHVSLQCGFKVTHHTKSVSGRWLLVITLALGLQPKQGLAKVWAKSEPKSYISCSRECKECEGMNLHIPK